MEALWRRGSATSADLSGSVTPATGWSPATVKTLLGRLVKKRAVTFEDRGSHYLYRPRVTREECVRAEARSLVDRVFGGDSASLLLHFIDEVELSPAEIAALRRKLDAKGEEE